MHPMTLCLGPVYRDAQNVVRLSILWLTNYFCVQVRLLHLRTPLLLVANARRINSLCTRFKIFTWTR